MSELSVRETAARAAEYRGKTRVVRRTVTDWTPAREGEHG